MRYLNALAAFGFFGLFGFFGIFGVPDAQPLQEGRQSLFDVVKGFIKIAGVPRVRDIAVFPREVQQLVHFARVIAADDPVQARRFSLSMRIR